MNDWSLAEQHAERAWRHYEAGRWDHALRLLRRALSIQPEQAEWLFGLGLTLDALQRFDQAADAYRRVLDIQPDDHEALLHLGTDLLRIGKAEEALKYLDRAHIADPEQHACQCHRIAAHAQLGDHDQAELVFYIAQQEEPDCPVCFDHIGHSLAMRGELRRALWCWQRTLKLDPFHAQARANAARAHWYLGELGLARAQFERHIEENSEDAHAKLELGSLLIETEELNLAEEQLNDALQQQADPAVTYHLLGDLHIKRGNAPAATACYQSARQHDPSRAGIDLGLALAAHLAGDNIARRQHLLDEMQQGGQDTRQVLELARQLLDAEMPDQAIGLLTPMIDGFDDLMATDDASLAEAHRLRALAMHTAGNHEQAILDCREAVRLNPNLTDAWQQLANNYEKAGQPQRALVCLNHAIDLDPDNSDLRKQATRLKRQALTRSAVRAIRRAA